MIFCFFDMVFRNLRS